MNRRILVTGGAGFIGSNLVHYLLDNYPNDSIVVADALTYSGNLRNLEKRNNDPQLDFVRLDICDFGALKDLILGRKFTHVFHLAAESHVDRSILGPEKFIQTNIIGTFNLLESLRAAGWAGRDDRRLLHVSTDEVYGSLDIDGLFTEETPYRPNSPYSASKASSDHLVRAYWHTFDVPSVTTNCSNNFGPYQFPEKLIPLMIVNCAQAKALPVYGSGSNVRDWLYVTDHASALDLVLNRGRLGESYNIGARNERSNMDIVRRICAIMDDLAPRGAPHDRLIEQVPDRPGHDFRYAIDPRKLESEFDWKPQFEFEAALRTTVQWYLQNADWWGPIITGEHAASHSRRVSS